MAVANTACRDGYGRALAEIAAQDANVLALDCDLGRSTRSLNITDVDAGRFVEMGIAEQDMISTAAGLALMGKTVFVNSFAVFITGRAFDQIRQQVSLPNANIKICGSSPGLTQGPDGATHQSVLDAGLMRILPNMTVITPADSEQAYMATWAAYRHKGPVYLRLSRYQTGNFLPIGSEFEIGKCHALQSGSQIAMVSCGPVLRNVIEAAQLLAKEGLSVGVYNFHTIKPLDTCVVHNLAKDYPLIVSVEEHSIYGGLGTAVAEMLAEQPPGRTRAKLLRLGVQDTFGESGSAEELLKKHRLDNQGIAGSVFGAWEENSKSALSWRENHRSE